MIKTAIPTLLILFSLLYPFVQAGAQLPYVSAATPAQGFAPIVAVYSDTGAWADGVIAFEHFLDWKTIAHERVSGADINRTDLRTRYAAIFFPGGYSGDFSRAINAVGDRNIRDLVNNGGGYVGICAGAYFAAKTIDWEGQVFNGELDLFDGRAFGSLTTIQPWPGHRLTTISLNTQHPLARFQQPRLTSLYYGGPSFHPNSGAVMDTVARWDQAGGTPAIITTRYGAGRVLLVGPHIEIEEQSSRDGSEFGSELSDPESDWGLLWSAMDWVLGQIPTDTSNVTTAPPLASRSATVELDCHPNPTQGYFSIRAHAPVDARITDLLGREMWRGRIEGNARIDASSWIPGMYLLYDRYRVLRIIRE